jgi:hypothetical protein
MHELIETARAAHRRADRSTPLFESITVSDLPRPPRSAPRLCVLPRISGQTARFTLFQNAKPDQLHADRAARTQEVSSTVLLDEAASRSSV